MILVLNCGSQSIKWKLFRKKNLKLLDQGEKTVFNSNNFEGILFREINKIKNKYFDKIQKIGHRVVHGGEKFRKPTKITKQVLKELEKFNKLAPLHNPFNILGIKVAKKVFPEIPQIAIFDTEFYKDLPEKVYIYPLPEKIRKKYKIRRFGFHGISHEYTAKEAAKRIKKPFEKLKIITCHLGGGSSITAIKNGKAVDTSMGFTPMEGLIMMTRSGDIDAGIVLELVKKFSLEKANKILNFESGLKGICGEENMLDVLKKAKQGNKKAKLALDLFVYRIQKYIGAYFAILGGCDLLIFTGTIGFFSAKIRNMICRDLTILKNTKILAIKTNEELSIAQKI
jgi:acetate kinase